MLNKVILIFVPENTTAKKLTKSILKTLGEGYELSAAILFPKVAKKIKGVEKFEGVATSRIRQTVKRLQKLKLVKVAQKGEKLVFELTKEGKKRLDKIDLGKLQFVKSGWDGKWRLVLFAIPESQKSLRESFRKNLKNLGFYQLQRGVLVTPYPCDKQIENLRRNLKAEDYITLVTATQIDKAALLKKHFNL